MNPQQQRQVEMAARDLCLQAGISFTLKKNALLSWNHSQTDSSVTAYIYIWCVNSEGSKNIRLVVRQSSIKNTVMPGQKCVSQPEKVWDIVPLLQSGQRRSRRDGESRRKREISLSGKKKWAKNVMARDSMEAAAWKCLGFVHHHQEPRQ